MRFFWAMIWATALAFLLAAPQPLAAKRQTGDSPGKCWLVQEVKRGPFTLKFFLTETDTQAVKAENLLGRYPNGQPDKAVGLSDSTRRRRFLAGSHPMYLEIWHGRHLYYVLNDFGFFSNFDNLEKTLKKNLDYPQKDFITYGLYFNTQDSVDGLSGRNIMLTISPREERLVVYKTDCSQDEFYRQVVGGEPASEFAGSKPGAGQTVVRHVCDPTLDSYGDLGPEGLPRPVRQVVFDSRGNRWRADLPGEFPHFYWKQIPMALAPYGVTLKTSLAANSGPAQVEKSGRALMAEILADQDEFIKKTELELAFISYSLLMMGLPENDVRQFFTTMAQQYAQTKDAFNWGEDPETIFNDLILSCRGFQPVERDDVFMAR